MSPSDDDAYSADLAELTHLLAEHPDLEACLHKVADLAVRVVPTCSGAGVVLSDPAGARTLAATDEDTWAVATYQYEHHEGPGVETVRYGEPRRIDDVGGESRWPGFCSTAQQHRVRSVLALPLQMAGDTSGALTLYARQPLAFTGVSHDLAVLFAARSGLALSNVDLYFASRRLVDQLHGALASRAVIEQAKGIVMARERCSPDEAFDILVGVSQRSDEKVRDVAAQLVAVVDGSRPEPS